MKPECSRQDERVLSAQSAFGSAALAWLTVTGSSVDFDNASMSFRDRFHLVPMCVVIGVISDQLEGDERQADR